MRWMFRQQPNDSGFISGKLVARHISLVPFPGFSHSHNKEKRLTNRLFYLISAYAN
jgi:hypothetical protein